MVDGFLPPGSVVKSFQSPLFIVRVCDKDITSTFVLGREYDYDKASGKLILRIPDNTCDQAACEMEVDVVEQKYFRFLNKA
jgi:hypothetical protein